MSNHPIVHIEISSTDREASGKFYANLFGWQIEQMPEMNYATFETKDGVGGGFNPVNKENPAGTVTIYVDSDDIDATLAQAEKLGGETITPKTEIPGVGWFGLFRDLSGNTIGVFTALPGMPS